MNTEAMVWLFVAIGFAILEASTIAMVSAWFSIGALVAMIAALFGAGIWVAVGIFLVVSALSLVAFRPIIKKYFNDKVVKTNIDAVIGSMGTVLEPIDNIAATGRVKLGGMEWSARSATGTPISAGTIIKVERIEGVKVFVRPTEELKEEVTL